MNSFFFSLLYILCALPMALNRRAQGCFGCCRRSRRAGFNYPRMNSPIGDCKLHARQHLSMPIYIRQYIIYVQAYAGNIKSAGSALKCHAWFEARAKLH